VLGLRLVKKTVNFDDPGTYHFYYGNETGSPGTILTFFPWERIKSGHTGTGMATEIGYTVPNGSLTFWEQRFQQMEVKFERIVERFGEQLLSFLDPDGLKLNLVISRETDNRQGWESKDVKKDAAIKGFHHITITLKNITATATILSDIFGYHFLYQEGSRHRFITDALETANVVDLVEARDEKIGLVAGGTNHHVAFRVKDESILMQFHDKVAATGLQITSKIDRNYFFSLYFREPGGVLFEIATDNPGFAIDEPIQELGTQLKLPVQYEESRKRIEDSLPVIN